MLDLFLTKSKVQGEERFVLQGLPLSIVFHILFFGSFFLS